jgi:ESS family glutamate:Na+ symporter
MFGSIIEKLEENTGAEWSLSIWDFMIVSGLLVLAIFLRSKGKFLQKWLIPNAIVAGLIGLLLGAEVLGRFTSFSLNTRYLADYPYHLLNITFCSIPLASEISLARFRKNGLSTGLIISFTQMAQVVVGVALALLFWVSPLMGTLFMFGFGTGPGQAYAVGGAYSRMGFFPEGVGQDLGLSFGALGYIFAIIFAIPLINWGIRNGYSKTKEIPEHVRKGLIKNEGPISGRCTSATEAIDTLTMQVAIVLFIYLISTIVYLALLEALPSSVTAYLGAFLYMICAMVSMAFRVIMDRMGISYTLDSGTQRRISGICTDMLVVSAIAALPITTLIKYAPPFFAIAVVGGFFTLLISMWLHKRAFSDHQFERLVFNYATHTGTAMTGIALLRVIDPEQESQAAGDYVTGMPLALVFQLIAVLLGGWLIRLNMGPVYLLMTILIMAMIWLAWPALGLWRSYKPIWRLWPD